MPGFRLVQPYIVRLVGQPENAVVLRVEVAKQHGV
jgi:hypothetical protein